MSHQREQWQCVWALVQQDETCSTTMSGAIEKTMGNARRVEQLAGPAVYSIAAR
jgi:hypothetical protein